MAERLPKQKAVQPQLFLRFFVLLHQLACQTAGWLAVAQKQMSLRKGVERLEPPAAFRLSRCPALRSLGWILTAADALQTEWFVAQGLEVPSRALSSVFVSDYAMLIATY